MLHNQSRDPAHFMCAKATIGHERYRLQPEFGHRPFPLHMDVRRFPTVGAEEDETVRSITKYSRHRAALLAYMFLYSEEDCTRNRKKRLLKKPNASAQPLPKAGATELGGDKARCLPVRFLIPPV